MWKSEAFYYLYGSMMSREEILANLEKMAAEQAALADARMQRAAEKLEQARKIQERTNYFMRYGKGEIDINPLPAEVIQPTSRVINFDPRYKTQE
jgi:hypothetical protein